MAYKPSSGYPMEASTENHRNEEKVAVVGSWTNYFFSWYVYGSSHCSICWAVNSGLLL